MRRASTSGATWEYRQALNLARDDNIRGLEARIVNSLGALYWAMNTPDQALTHFHSALSLAHEIHQLSTEADAHHGLAQISYDLRQYQQARSHSDSAQSLYVKLNSPQVAS